MTDISGSAYLAYKHDTSVFLSWISQSSEKCGWSLQKGTAPEVKRSVKSTPQAKGKGRKKSKKISEAEVKKVLENHQESAPAKKLSVAELVERIDFVEKALAKQIGESMPSSVWKALRRSIKARERFAQWYRSSKSAPNDKHESHDHFIKVLKKATFLFKGKPNTSRQTKPSHDEVNQRDNLPVKNLFECLELEDISESDDPDVLDGDDRLDPPQMNTPTEFDIEPSDAELHFAIFSLFEDVHRMRAEAQRIFRSLVADEISLMKATLSIAVAIDLIRKAAEEVILVADANPPPEFNGPWLSGGAYPAFVSKLTYDRIVGRDGDMTAQLESWGDFEEFVLLPLGSTLKEIGRRSETLKTGKSDFICPFVSLSYSYKKFPEKLNDTRIQRGIEEDHLLKHFYLEMRFMEDLKEGRFDAIFPSDMDKSERQRRMRKSGLPFYDVFHDVLRPVWRENVVSFEAAFAARVMVDMHEICGTSLQYSSVPPKVATQYYDRYGFSEQGDTDVKSWVRELKIPDSVPILSLVVQIRMRVDHDLISKAVWQLARTFMGKQARSVRQKWTESEVEHVEVDNGVWLHDSTTFLQDANVLYGGTAMLDMVTKSEITEMRIADCHNSIFCVAHIYNAARQLAGLDTAWPAMDRVIELQKDAIFANDIPKTANAVLTRLIYRSGVASVENLKRSLVGHGPRPWKFRPTPTTIIIREYLAGNITLARMVHQLDEKAVEYEASKEQDQSSQPSQRPSQKSHAARRNRRQATLTKTLNRVEDYLDAVLPDIQFNYLELARACNYIVKAVRMGMEMEFETSFRIPIDRIGQGVYLAPMELALMILEENHVASRVYEKVGRRAQERGLSPVGDGLQFATELLKVWLEKPADGNPAPEGSPAPEDGPI